MNLEWLIRFEHMCIWCPFLDHTKPYTTQIKVYVQDE